jgi:hypothetical protein
MKTFKQFVKEAITGFAIELGGNRTGARGYTVTKKRKKK